MTTSTRADAQTKVDNLAFLGGRPSIPEDDATLAPMFHWPIVTEEDEHAVLDVLRKGTMSSWDISMEFEQEFAEYLGVRHALSYPNGTMALQVAMWAAGLRRGDEMICPAITYWGSCFQALALGVPLVFADIDPESLCIDPIDIERRIGPRTKAIMVVHYHGHPADMDSITSIARRRGLKVIEDCSHAQGTEYKGRKVGAFGDVAAMSLMTGKSFAIGEGGILVTNDSSIHEAAMAYSHYERCKQALTDPSLRMATGADTALQVPLGAVKGRLNQICAAMGRVQLCHYPRRIAEIQSAVSRFWDLLADVPGITPHRTSEEGSTMGGWYQPLGLYDAAALGGLPVSRFVEAVQAEGGRSHSKSMYRPLYRHPMARDVDVYGDGKATILAFADRDVRLDAGSLPVAESVTSRTFGIPWFKHDDRELITRFAAAYRKVASQADRLL